MRRGAVEKNRGFPQFLDTFPLLFAQSGRLEGRPVVLGSGVFGCLTGGLCEGSSGGIGLSCEQINCAAVSLV